MATIGTLPGDRLAGLLIDQIEKIRKGALTLDELALFVQRKNPFELRVEVRLKLLELVTSVFVPSVEWFAAAEHFKVETRKAKVKIVVLAENFRNNFLEMIEENLPAGALRVHKLLKSSVDKLIIAELGEHDTYLADLWMMLEKQPNGEEGSLLVNGWSNIFYIKSKNSQLWAVYAYWNATDGGWYVRANSVTSPYEWDAGYQVVSR